MIPQTLLAIESIILGGVACAALLLAREIRLLR